ncbi:MAG: PASTA domain-containing protein [Bacteroidales bacterium]|nr:PASTA domain-containing protein [Candidatus Cryptobacteroides caccocaballi]
MGVKDIFSNWIVRNLVAAAALVIALLFIAIVSLKFITKHDQVLTVPDFTNMQVSEAKALAADSGVRVEVADSVFVRRMAKGAVYRQDPTAGSAVKEGRRVLLVINAVNAKKVTVPNVVGCSMRQAKAELLSRGLRLGNLVYVNDIATNNVLKQQIRGRDVRPGTQVDSETAVDLVVGLSSSDNTTNVPKVIGLKSTPAVDVVHDYSLNVKRMVYDDSVLNYADSLDAVVYRQSPETSDVPTAMGSEMTLYLTVNPERIPKR